MKVFIVVLVLIFSFQSLTRADDIRDFEIEGISIGDSALDFFSEEKIKYNSYDYYNDKEYTPVQILNDELYQISLLYTGITRAKEKLDLSDALHRGLD